MYYKLKINNYKMNLILGNNEIEKHCTRPVLLNIEIKFFKPNNASKSDNLDDTICYDTILNIVKNTLENKAFNLIECATLHIYNIVKNHVNEANIRVELEKNYPMNSLESASFVCSDWE